MKTHFVCAFILAWTVCQASGTQMGLTDIQKEIPSSEWGAPNYNTQVAIVLKNNEKEFKTNQVVELLVGIKNLSTNDEYGVMVQNPFLLSESFDFVVTSPSGKDISPIFHESFRVSGGVIWVHPGKIDGFGFNLSEICRTDEIGTYTIVIKMKRATPDRRKVLEILSKPLYVKIVPDK